MSTSETNKDAIIRGLEKAVNLTYRHLEEQVVKFCVQMIYNTDFSAGYQNLTGNTFTSYSLGIYIDGALRTVVKASDYRKPALRVKINKDEMVFDFISYDGVHVQFFAGSVEVTEEFGKDTAYRFLSNYKPLIVSGITVVMCTGTEYSEHLEDIGLNVLTEDYEASGNVLLANLKPMRNG